MPTEERGSIGSVKPSGWQTIKYENVDGKYLYTASLYKDKTPLLGDVNLDGNVNIRDATAIQKHLANIETIEGLGKPASDYNQDGKITIQDATAIQKKIANIA